MQYGIGIGVGKLRTKQMRQPAQRTTNRVSTQVSRGYCPRSRRRGVCSTVSLRGEEPEVRTMGQRSFCGALAMLVSFVLALTTLGCDATQRTELTVEIVESVVPAHGDPLFVMSRWFEVEGDVLSIEGAEIVRSAKGHAPTREWKALGAHEAEQPIRDGRAELEYAYAATRGRGLAGTWLAVKRSVGEDWETQEFIVRKGDSGYSVRSIVRSGEGGPAAIGLECGAVTAIESKSSAASGWRIVMNLGPWKPRKDK
jgi:hypothetical protein